MGVWTVTFQDSRDTAVHDFEAEVSGSLVHAEFHHLIEGIDHAGQEADFGLVILGLAGEAVQTAQQSTPQKRRRTKQVAVS